MQCRALGERALRNGEVAEGIRLLEKAQRLGGCPGLEAWLSRGHGRLGRTRCGRPRRRAAQRHGHRPLSSGFRMVGAPSHDLTGHRGGVVADRYAWSQSKDGVGPCELGDVGYT